jgi:hypothetical protein
VNETANKKTSGMTQNDSTAEKEKVPGVLNIPRLFEAEALSLLEAVERGKLLHGTKNIRDSGGPLEVRLRSLLADRMPEGIQVKTGYLYDLESNCTPQIDAMLLSGEDNHTMMTTQEGAVYAPFTGVLATIEIKSSVGDVAKQLRQTNEIIKSIKRMAKVLRQRRNADIDHKVVSVLFYASSTDAKFDDFKKWCTENRADMPTYVVFLDRGYIIAAQHLMHSLLKFEEPQPVGFDDYHNGDRHHLWAPKEDSEFKRGNVLLWLYFTLLNVADRFNGRLREPDPLNEYRMNGDKSIKSFATSFIEDAVSRYGLYTKGSLEDLEGWPEVTAKKAEEPAKKVAGEAVNKKD